MLTPYLGQLQKLRAAMRNDFEIVLNERDEEKLAKDGYLDEKETWESDSGQTRGLNIQKKAMNELSPNRYCGYFPRRGSKGNHLPCSKQCGEESRIFENNHVLLSRAQHGMYLIGNTKTYSNIRCGLRSLACFESTIW